MKRDKRIPTEMVIDLKNFTLILNEMSSVSLTKIKLGLLTTRYKMQFTFL